MPITGVEGVDPAGVGVAIWLEVIGADVEVEAARERILKTLFLLWVSREQLLRLSMMANTASTMDVNLCQ